MLDSKPGRRVPTNASVSTSPFIFNEQSSPIIKDLTPQLMPPHPPNRFRLLFVEKRIPNHQIVEINHLKRGMIKMRLGTGLHTDEENGMVVARLVAAVAAHEGA